MSSNFPTKSDREKCWSSRDALWNCLDRNSDDRNKCLKEQKEFQSMCSKAWVKYFDRRREYLQFKQKLETEGSEPLEQQEK